MNKINTEQLLSQIRQMSDSLKVPESNTTSPNVNFGEMLKNSLDAVNDAQQTSSQLKVDFVSGKKDVGLAEVMIASQKANLSFRAVTEVRNKLITAYQDIMNMPV